MIDRPLWVFPILFALFLLVAQVQAPFGRTAIPPADLWNVLLPLGGSSGLDQAHQAFQRAEQLGKTLGKILLHKKMDSDLSEAFGVILQRSHNLNLKGLYTHPKIPWREGYEKQKSFSYRGWIENESYRMSFASPSPPPLDRLGDMTSRLTLSPLKKGFLLVSKHELHTGSLGMQEELAMVEILLSLLDASRPLSSVKNRISGERDPADRYFKKLFQEGFPYLSSFLDRYLKVTDLSQVYPDPLLGRPVTRVNLSLHIREGFLEDHHPHLYRAYKKLIRSSASILRVKNVSGDCLGEMIRKGKRVSLRFLTREGKLYPADNRWKAAGTEGLSPYRFRQLPHVLELSAWIRLLGMKFGMQEISFYSTYQDGVSTWSMTKVPELILPLGIKQLFSSFLYPFLEYLYQGENNQGFSYQLVFRSAGEGYIHQANLSLPLRDSPLLSFLLRLGGGLSRNLSPKAYQEAHQVLREMAKALGQDYLQAKTNFFVASLD